MFYWVNVSYKSWIGEENSSLETLSIMDAFSSLRFSEGYEGKIEDLSAFSSGDLGRVGIDVLVIMDDPVKATLTVLEDWEKVRPLILERMGLDNPLVVEELIIKVEEHFGENTPKSRHILRQPRSS